MNASRLLPITLLFCAAAALLRLWQSLSGFEADTGLPVAGHPAAPLLAAVLLAAAFLLFFLTASDKNRRIQASDLGCGKPQPYGGSGQEQRAQAGDLGCGKPQPYGGSGRSLRGPLTLGSALYFVSGVLVVAGQLPSVLAELGDSAGLGSIPLLLSHLNGLYVPLLTALVLCAASLFLLRLLWGKVDAVPAPASVGKVPGGLTAALPTLGCCLLLVFVYQNHANDPVAQSFLWPEVAFFCAMPAWYTLSGLWYAPGNRRTLAWLCLTAAVAQCTALCAPAGVFSPAVLFALLGNLIWFLSCAALLLRVPQDAE